MGMTPVEIFKAMNGQGVKNVKEYEGLHIKPVAYHTHTYESQDGKEHTVLVIKNGEDGELYKTEVQAFIKLYMAYEEAFGTLEESEKPAIIVKLVKSQKGNNYVSFDVEDLEA